MRVFKSNDMGTMHGKIKSSATRHKASRLVHATLLQRQAMPRLVPCASGAPSHRAARAPLSPTRGASLLKIHIRQRYSTLLQWPLISGKQARHRHNAPPPLFRQHALPASYLPPSPRPRACPVLAHQTPTLLLAHFAAIATHLARLYRH